MTVCFTLIYISFLSFTICNEKNVYTKNKSLKIFRKNVEEATVKPYQDKEINKTNTSLEKFIVNYVKEIFIKDEDFNVTSTTTSCILNHSMYFNVSTSSILTSPTLPNMEILKYKATKKTKLEKDKQASGNEKNNSWDIKLKQNNSFKIDNTTTYVITTSSEFFNLSKTSGIYQTEKINKLEFQELPVFKKRKKDTGLRRICILCNNVVNMECDDPRNKVISSITCEHEDDQCYSFQTPFRIIERGCFNINANLTTYVCSCNLCNYISISEMPRIFSTRKDWVEDIIEVSRTKHLRKSVLKDISCLSCEVNNIRASETADTLDIANCLEGNIATLPIQECGENEICGVKAIRSEGYIWRGCLTSPLYNYWWSICNTDLCNYEQLFSVYDEIHN